MYRRGGNESFRTGRRVKGNVTKAPLKGLFSDGIWKCNCDPRLPAQHFQTKNGGKNHGRWFYTCQLPQPKRCDFFIWDDEAKGREAAAVLNNSRTEPVTPPATSPTTPTRTSSYGLPTPQSEQRVASLETRHVQTPFTPSKPLRSSVLSGSKVETRRNDTQGATTTVDSDGEEYYDWPASDEDEMGEVVDQASSKESSVQTTSMRPPETPRKAIRTETISSPGKRRYDDSEKSNAYATPITGGSRADNDIFTTPSTTKRSNLFNAENISSPAGTPTPIRHRDIQSGQDSELATEILTSLQNALSAPLLAEARDNIKNICNRHVLYTKGIMKGRDVSRLMVRKKEEQIAELQSEVEGLKTERETNRAVIQHLRRSTPGTKEEI